MGGEEGDITLMLYSVRFEAAVFSLTKSVWLSTFVPENPATNTL